MPPCWKNTITNAKSFIQHQMKIKRHNMKCHRTLYLVQIRKGIYQKRINQQGRKTSGDLATTSSRTLLFLSAIMQQMNTKKSDSSTKNNKCKDLNRVMVYYIYMNNKIRYFRQCCINCRKTAATVAFPTAIATATKTSFIQPGRKCCQRFGQANSSGKFRSGWISTTKMHSVR